MNNCNNYPQYYWEALHLGCTDEALRTVLVAKVYPEMECGFHADRSTIDLVFSIRQLQEKCREQRQPLFVAILRKVFDLVDRDALFKILLKTGCPLRLLKIIRSFHEDMKGTMVVDSSTSDAFDTQSGVKQGCVLAPTLFGIFSAVLQKRASGCATAGFYLWAGQVKWKALQLLQTKSEV